MGGGHVAAPVVPAAAKSTPPPTSDVGGRESALSYPASNNNNKNKNNAPSHALSPILIAFSVFLIVCDIVTICLLSRANHIWVSISISAGYLLVVFPRFDANTVKLYLQCEARVLFWLVAFHFRFVCLESTWALNIHCWFLTIFALVAPYVLAAEEPELTRLGLDSKTVTCGSSAILCVVTFLILCPVHGMPVDFIPPPYNAISNHSFVQRPLLHHQLTANILHSNSLTVVYGHEGTGRRSLVAKTLMDLDYDVAWMTIEARDAYTFKSIVSRKVAGDFTDNHKYTVRSTENWKLNRELFYQQTRHALVVDYSLIDLTVFFAYDGLRNDMNVLNDIASSLGIKVIVIANEMVSIFDAANRAGVVPFFVKVDDFTHDEAVQFFNQTASRSALSISNDEMESLFARVGTRPIDIRNCIDAIASSKRYHSSVHEYALKAEEVELRSVMGWMDENSMTNPFVESDSCMHIDVDEVVSRWNGCGIVACDDAETGYTLARGCTDYDGKVKIMSRLLMNPNGFEHVMASLSADIKLLKSLLHIIDIDVDFNNNHLAHIKPRSTIQKTLMMDKKIVHIKECSSLEMKVKNAVGRLLSRLG